MKNKTYKTYFATLLLALTGFIAKAQWVNCGTQPFNVPELIKIGDSLHTYGLINNFSSANNGDTWIKDSIHGMGVYPNLISIEESGGKYFGGDPYGHIYESTDGLFWTQNYYLGYAAELPYMLTEGSNIYVVVDGVGILRSNDGGINWLMGDTGLTSNGNNINQIVKIGNDLFISTLDGIFKSTDGGNNWVQKNNGLPTGIQCNGIAYNQGALLTSSYGQGVFRSADMGENWTQVSSGFNGFLYVGGFYTYGNLTVVGGALCKAHFSTDGGLTWSLIAPGAGFGSAVFKDFLVDNGYLFAATSAWCMRIALADLGVTTAIEGFSNRADGVTIFPNPASSSITIATAVDLDKIETIRLVDLNGKLVMDTEALTSTIIDLSGLTNGCYILYATIDGMTCRRKIIIYR